MREYIDEAIILNKRASGDLDARYSIFTKRFGKMIARAKSSRKMTSKLAGHLEPGTVAEVRLIEMHGLQVVDALKNGSLMEGGQISLVELAHVDRLLAEGEPELFIWNMVRSGRFDSAAALGALGWDPQEAVCSVCGKNPVAGFSISRQEFFCGRCVVRIPKYDILILHGAVQSELNMEEQGNPRIGG